MDTFNIEEFVMNANDKQVGGDHYKTKIQHWDFAASNNMDYFQGQITKYVTRWKNKNGYEDLEKAKHFLDKYMELEGVKVVPDLGDRHLDEDIAARLHKGVEPCPSYVDQD
tara:strand:+ start:9342 stop:9674 length:333 start_codon:yes stop_codon:yes gene_type:complete